MTFNDKNQDKNRAEAPLKHHWGTRFKTAREAMHLTEKDAAARLHLKPHIITVIETERFENGPPAIFMRGYIRSYARLLNIPEKEAAQALAQLNLENPATSTPTASTRSRISTPNNSNTGWSTSLVVLVLVGLVGMWWNTHSRNSLKETAIASSAQAVTPVASNPAPTIDNTNTPQAPMDPTPKELLNSQAVASTSPKTPATVPTVTAETAINNSPAPALASAPSTPTQNPNTVASTKPTQAITQAQQATTPTATPDDNAVAESTKSNDSPTLATTAETDTEAKLAKSKTRIAKLKTPDTASDEMAIPEQGLDPEDNNN